MSTLDKKVLRYLLFDVHKVTELCKRERYQDHDEETMSMYLDAVSDFSDKELAPCFREMDSQPARYDNGKIWVHPQVEVMMKQGAELGLVGGTFDYERGGSQLPYSLYTAAVAIMEGANNHLPGYLGLTYGSAELILEYASEELKNEYLPPMIDGTYAGTMCLTEPQAGSSLSDIVSTAKLQDDGSYLVSGTKIFISGGDHEYADNFVHLFLARIEGAPKGTKGISLFVVPKYRKNASGELVSNDVTTAGDFQKLGQKGYCTTHLAFGEAGDCKAWLVGQENVGLKYMFKMMNGARIAVGRGAAAICMASHQAALQYAKERPQGRPLTNDGSKDVGAEQSLIIKHPDVRRMLLLQQAIGEGAMSLILQAAHYYDILHTAESDEEREKYRLLVELLTPVVKTYPSEAGKLATSTGVQVLGGYGYCEEFVLQQYYRDIRIFSIYEGTTGIQSLDLLGRKVMMQNGKALELLLGEINTTISAAEAFPELKANAAKLQKYLGQAQQTLQFLFKYAAQGKYQHFTADANLFMELFSLLVISWQWLKIGVNCHQTLLTDAGSERDFLESRIHAMKFFFRYELPRVGYLARVIQDEELLTTENIPAELRVD